MRAVAFTVLGPPVGKGRPRFSRKTGRAYTPPATEAAEGNVREAFLRQARSGPLDGPLALDVRVLMARPAGHYRRDGDLSAAGQRAHYPAKRPDSDNLVKLICDALEGLAYRNDAQIVDVTVSKRWLHPRAGVEQTIVRLGPLPADGTGSALWPDGSLATAGVAA